MSNETYLIVSYFCIALLCIGIALVVLFVLWRPFLKLISYIQNRSFALLLRKIFLIGIVFPALLGFFSVSFKSCSVDSYEKIIEERSYLIQKNQEQTAASLKYITLALFVWMIMTFGVVIVIKQSNKNIT